MLDWNIVPDVNLLRWRYQTYLKEEIALHCRWRGIKLTKNVVEDIRQNIMSFKEFAELDSSYNSSYLVGRLLHSAPEGVERFSEREARQHGMHIINPIKEIATAALA